ncbi:integrase domain-containing protein [Paraburkholderia sp.]|uniref:integrase domain-containing protein n=1 Tax=Paraburkholderia sp. TaxID=1926495 RepID=UPI003C7D3544
MAMIQMFDADRLLAKYRLPQRMRDELKVLFRDNIGRSLSRTRVSKNKLASDTQGKRANTICATLVNIRKLGFKIESIYSVEGRHLRAVVAHWIDSGEAVGTMQGKLAHLKAFLEWMGKYGLVKSLYDYRSKEELAAMGRNRSYVTTTDKSWEANGVDVDAIFAQIAQTDPHVAVQLKLQAAFGLRVKESCMLRIRKTLLELQSRDDDKFRVDKGTKGGRERDVPLQLKLEVLHEALRLANDTTGSTIPSDYDWPRWRRRYYGILAQHGITKDEKGVTSHGLRHGWMQQRYEVLSGSPAPIKGSEERPDRATHDATLRVIIEEVGHSKPEKSGMYISTPAAMAKLRAPVVTIEDVRRTLEKTGGEKKAAAAKLGISRQKVYRILESGAQNG